MTYATFSTWAFFVYLVGCFVAFVLSLRHHPDNRVMAFVYGSWISAAFAAHHLLIPSAAQTWHHWWYIWNAVVGGFPIMPAYMLRECDARKPIVVLSVLTVLLCSIYSVFSYIHLPLPGVIYFYASSLFESSLILSMIIWSGPIIPLFMKAWNAIARNRSKMWTQHRVQA